LQKKLFQYGISALRKYGAELYVIHVVHILSVTRDGDLANTIFGGGVKKFSWKCERRLAAIINSEKKRAESETVVKERRS